MKKFLLLLTLLPSFAFAEGFFLGLKANLLTSASGEVDFSDIPTIDWELDDGSITPSLLIGYGISLGPGELRPSFEYQLTNTEYDASDTLPNELSTIEYTTLGLNIDYIYDINQQIGAYGGLAITDFTNENDFTSDLPEGIAFGLNLGGVYSINNIDIDASFRYYLTDLEEEPNNSTTYTFTPEYVLGLGVNYNFGF